MYCMYVFVQKKADMRGLMQDSHFYIKLRTEQ